MIEKFKHGSEVSSERLNEIIDTLNKVTTTYSKVQILADTADDKLSAVNATLESINSQLSTIPEISKLYTELLLAKDSVDWYEISQDDNNSLTLLESELLTQNFKAERLRVLRGPDSLINLNTPALRDKQILIAYELVNGVTTSVKLYMDFYDIPSGRVKRILINSNVDATITMEAPELSFEYEGTTEEDTSQYLVIKEPGKSSVRSKYRINGSTGATGASGPQGPAGTVSVGTVTMLNEGDKPFVTNTGSAQNAVLNFGIPKGTQGLQGPAGPTPIVEIHYSTDMTGRDTNTEFSDTYSYVGIRIRAGENDTGWRYFPTKSDTYYPTHYDESTGYLTFSKEKPSGKLSFKVKGPKGDKGDAGPAPKISFKKGDELVELLYEGTNGEYVYDINNFRGPKGDQGERGPQGNAGPEGPTGRFGEPKASIINTDKPFVSVQASGTDEGKIFSFTFGLPKGEKGEPGQTGKAFTISKVVETVDNLPEPNDYELGSAVAVGDGTTKRDIYILTKENDITKWVNFGPIEGEQGKRGARGYTGAGSLISKITANVDNQTGTPSCIVTETASETITQEDGEDIITTISKSFHLDFKGLKGETGNTGLQGPQGNPGPQGPAGKITVGNITTLPAGTSATVSERGTPENRILDFGIPKGDKGDKGEQGTIGSQIFFSSIKGAPTSFASYRYRDVVIDPETDIYYYDTIENTPTWVNKGRLKSPAKDYLSYLKITTLASTHTEYEFKGVTNYNTEESVVLSIPKSTSYLTNDAGFLTAETAPVRSVNKKTGDISLTYADVKALPDTATAKNVGALSITGSHNTCEIEKLWSGCVSYLDIPLPLSHLENDRMLLFTALVSDEGLVVSAFVPEKYFCTIDNKSHADENKSNLKYLIRATTKGTNKTLLLWYEDNKILHIEDPNGNMALTNIYRLKFRYTGEKMNIDD